MNKEEIAELMARYETYVLADAEVGIAESAKALKKVRKEVRKALRGPQPEYEYGTRWVVEGAPAERLTYLEGSLEYAQWVIEEDRIAVGVKEPRGTLVRRLKVGEWEEVE